MRQLLVFPAALALMAHIAHAQGAAPAQGAPPAQGAAPATPPPPEMTKTAPGQAQAVRTLKASAKV
ncbi:MAG TPA: hypothetical protein VEJ89_14060, partial [Myxococcaceae bacterium]|nr:hypothetical protein [Myxococcaceae bacterium]